MARNGRVHTPGGIGHVALTVGFLAFLLLGFGFLGAIVAPPAQADAVDDEVALIQAEIDANGYCWTAGRTSVLEMPPADRRSLRGLTLPPGATGMLTPEQISERPAPGTFRSYFSWKDEGKMSRVKSQGGCGACWCFSPIAVFESYIMIVTGVEQDLSEQQMVSCTSDGCNGGWMSVAYNLMRSYGCVDELCMPYEASDNVPCTQYECDLVDKIQGYYGVTNSVTSIKAALANGPLSCGMTVYDSFEGYTGGCYQYSGNWPVDHAVVICGWDDAACAGAGAWHCKNSWGTSWGEDGYFWIRFGSCHIGYCAQQVDYSPLYPVVIAHAPLRNTDDTHNGYLVGGEVYAYLDDVSWARIYYRVDGGAYSPVTMDNVRSDTYQGYIPAQPLGSVIDYYIQAQDDGGRAGYHPKQGPPEHHTFRVVSFITMDDCETPGDWTLGVVDDDASEGFWECGDPEGTTYSGHPVQSEDDTTIDPGANCFVTGVLSEGFVNNNDVDEGKTTLVSPTFDLSELTEVFLEFDLWFVNDAGYAPVNDDFYVDVSNNGGDTWTNLLTLTDDWFPGAWERYQFDLQDEIALTSEVVIRFVASDYGIPNTVEAAVDEFEISTPEGLQGVPSLNPQPWTLALRSPQPNPTSLGARVAFTLSREGRADLGIYSLDGRLERVLLRGHASAGAHEVSWDGRDGAGRTLPSGIYYMKLSTEEGERSAQLTIVR
jgi:hypothetical protein